MSGEAAVRLLREAGFEVEAPVVLDRNRRCSRQIFEAARRVIARNPTLFEKRLEADRDSEHGVVAHAFDHDVAETDWLLADLRRDREVSRLEWGDYALLYRTHAIGQYLETRCLEAGIPCRLAQGQSVRDDDLIAFVLASLTVIRSPEDELAIDAFADRVLPRQLVDEVRALRSRADLDLSMPSMRCVGYRQTWEALDAADPPDMAALRERGVAATRQLAKRQLTWLRSMPGRHVVAADAADAVSQVVALAQQLAG